MSHDIETYSFLERTHAQHARVSVRPLIFFSFKAEASAEKISKAMTLPGTVKKVGVQAGSGGSVLKCSGADLWLTGECGHHDVLAAAAEGVSVILTDHTNTERGFLKRMASQLGEALSKAGHSDVPILISSRDADPLQVV